MPGRQEPDRAKGARLTQEISLAGRFVVLLPGSSGLGVSKRLPDRERKRLTAIVKPVHPKGHGLILRTAAENITAPEIERDIARLVGQWEDIEQLAERSSPPALLYRESEATLRLIREELTSDYRVVVIDNLDLYEEVSDYISSIIPHFADRVKYYDTDRQRLPLFERYYVVAQLRKAINPKVWLPSGGSIIIEHTEALTVVDVNTSKNVGKSNLEDTVLENNLEAADEVARQLRLRDIGGIIVVDFVDMDAAANRAQVVSRFKEALARDKTRTQVLDISALGLLEMTRKRIGGGLLESLSDVCECCSGPWLAIARQLGVAVNIGRVAFNTGLDSAVAVNIDGYSCRYRLGRAGVPDSAYAAPGDRTQPTRRRGTGLSRRQRSCVSALSDGSCDGPLCSYGSRLWLRLCRCV